MVHWGYVIKNHIVGNNSSTVSAGGSYMEKLGSIIGLPIVETETGTQIGEIGEIVVNVEEAILFGLIISGSNWFSGENIITFEEVASVGRDAVMISNHHVIRSIDTLSIANYNYYLRDLLNKEIITDGGLRLGILTNIMVNSVTGEIKWYEISDSMVMDLLYGRMIMPLPQVQIVGQDKVIVPETMKNFLHEEKVITDE